MMRAVTAWVKASMAAVLLLAAVGGCSTHLPTSARIEAASPEGFDTWSTTYVYLEREAG